MSKLIFHCLNTEFLIYYFHHHDSVLRISSIFDPSKGVPCLRNQTQKQAENIPIDGVKFVSFIFMWSRTLKNKLIIITPEST
jgi:hypothetical protein